MATKTTDEPRDLVQAALDDDLREQRLNVRLTQLEAAKVDRQRGPLSRSDFARQAIMAACEGRPGAPPAVHTEDLRVIKEAIFKLGKVTRKEIQPLLVEILSKIMEHTTDHPSRVIQIEARQRAQTAVDKVLDRIGMHIDEDGKAVSNADLQKAIQQLQATVDQRFTPAPRKGWWFTRYRKGKRG